MDPCARITVLYARFERALGSAVAEHDPVAQQVLKRRALEGQHPGRPEEIVEWLGAAARGRDPDPMPFERAAEEGPARACSKGRLCPGRIEELAVGGSFVEDTEPR